MFGGMGGNGYEAKNKAPRNREAQMNYAVRITLSGYVLPRHQKSWQWCGV